MISLTVALDQQSSDQNLTDHLLKMSFDVLDEVEVEDLVRSMLTQLAEGMPSDMEFSGF